MTRVESMKRSAARERASERRARTGVSKMFGKLKAEYAIYETNASALGWRVKSFNEWLND